MSHESPTEPNESFENMPLTGLHDVKMMMEKDFSLIPEDEQIVIGLESRIGEALHKEIDTLQVEEIDQLRETANAIYMDILQRDKSQLGQEAKYFLTDILDNLEGFIGELDRIKDHPEQR